MSAVLRDAAIAPWLTLAGGVGVAEGLRAATGLPVQLKWPNDVVATAGPAFRARRKLAGILAEASSTSDGLQSVVLGFGINVRADAFPPELGDRATSLEVELGLEKVIPSEFMLHAHHWLILHGRYTCLARKPLCERCVINDLCRWPEKTVLS